MPMVNLGSTKGQNWLKPYQNNIFHVFKSNLRLLEIFINFDQIWPKVSLNGDRKLTFDLTIWLEWNQHHCKEYWIPFQMTAHRLKSELRRVGARECALTLGVDRGEGWKMKSPPRLGLGTILGLLGQSFTCIGLHTRLWVQSLGTV